MAHPTAFIKAEDGDEGSYNASNWLIASTTALWSHDVKTIYDPCPKGYKIANNGTTSSSYAAINSENLLPYPAEEPHGRLYEPDVWFPVTGYRGAAAGALNGVRTTCYLTAGGTAYATDTDGVQTHYVRSFYFTTTTMSANYYYNVRRATAIGARCIEWEADR